MRGHAALKHHLDRFRDRHACLTCGQRQRNGARIRAKGNPLGHSGMRIPANNNRPVIHGDIIQNLVNNIGHGVIFIFWIARGNQPEFMHKFHQARGVFLGFEIPHRGGMTARLIGPVNGWRDNRSCHRFQLLCRHQASRILRADNIYLYPRIRASMHDDIAIHASGIGIKDFFNRGQALPLMRDNFGRGENRQRGYA